MDRPEGRKVTTSKEFIAHFIPDYTPPVCFLCEQEITGKRWKVREKDVCRECFLEVTGRGTE